MATINVEKSTREKINNLRRGSRTQDDTLNRMIDAITTFESFLESPFSGFDQFVQQLSESENVKEKLAHVLDEQKIYLNTCPCGNMWESHTPVKCKNCVRNNLDIDKILKPLDIDELRKPLNPSGLDQFFWN